MMMVALEGFDPVGPLTPPNLLILRNGRNATLRYTAGTRNTKFVPRRQLPASWENGALPAVR